MRSQQHLHFTRQPHAHARAVAQVQEQDQHKIIIIMMVAYALASAIIILWMAYMPTLTGGILTNLNTVPTHLLSASDSFNRANKDDRLTNVQFNDRWSALAAIKIQTLQENGIHARATWPSEEHPANSGWLRTGVRPSRQDGKFHHPLHCKRGYPYGAGLSRTGATYHPARQGGWDIDRSVLWLGLFLFVIFVVFLELGFFFEKKFFKPPTLCKIGSDFEHCPKVRDVLSYDKTLHTSLRKTEPPPRLDLDQCAVA